MSHVHRHDVEDEELPEDEIIDEEIPEEEEEEIIRTPEETEVEPVEETPIRVHARNPKIDAILRNPDVVEVHIRYRRGGPRRVRQPYVCIIFRDGSTIERPLADLSYNENPICPRPETMNPPVDECNCGGHGGHGHGRGNTNGNGIVPSNRMRPIERNRSRWNWLRLKHRDADMDIASIVENSDNVIVKREVTVIRKGCGCGSGNGGRRNRRRYPRRNSGQNWQYME